MERAPFFSSNVVTLAETGILGNSWRLPPPHPPERTPLNALYIVAKPVHQTRSWHFL